MPPENLLYVRRMSDSSENSQRNDRHSSENTHINERHTHQRNNFPEDILRSNHEDLSQLEDQWGAKQTRDSEVFTHNNLSEFDGMFLKSLYNMHK